MPRRTLLPGAALALGLALLGLSRLEPAPPQAGLLRTSAPAGSSLSALRAREIEAALARRFPQGDPRLARLAPGTDEREQIGPAPTDQGPGEEGEDRELRERWLAGRHRAPPGYDWLAADRRAGRDQVARRAEPPAAEVPVAASSSRWSERGSDNQAGRMHAAVRSPNGQTLIAGSSGGGLWTRDLGDSSVPWTPIGDDLYGGVHWVQAVPGATEGEPPVIVTSTDWGYVNRSTDGGATWQGASLDHTINAVRRLARSSDGSQALFLVASNNSRSYLMRSTDQGASFQTVRDLGSYGGDLFVPRTGDSRVYLGTASAVLFSDDLGDTWTEAGAFSGGGSCRLVGSEAGAPTLYALVDDAVLWRSDDTGESWREQIRVNDFYGHIAASIVDPALVVWGGVELWRSFDGGASASKQNDWYDYYDRPQDRLHADIFGLEVAPDDDGGETWYIGSDGGLFSSTDDLATVNNLSLHGLRVSQYYSTLTHKDDADTVAAGAQDQGYQVSTGLGEATRFEMNQALSGDYGHLVSGDGTHEIVFSDYPGFVLVQLGEGGRQLGYVDFPADEAGAYYAWIPPLAADPDEPSTFYLCATHLYRYTFDGDAWNAERWSDQDFSVAAYEFMSAFSMAPRRPDKAYAATSYGRLFHSEDRGKTWTRSSDTGPSSHYFYGTAVVVDDDNPRKAWVGGAGYGGPAVYRTRDGGETWEAWGQGLPDTLVYGLAQTTDGSDRIFAGTETAAYVRGPDDDAWVDITGSEAPIVTWWSVEALQSEPTMRFGSYGRGIWDYHYDEAPAVSEPDTGGDTAADGGADGGTDGGGDPGKTVGCGCGGGSPATLALLLPALLGLAGRRRRRTLAP